MLLLAELTDDQTALVGCAVAFGLSAGLMFVSYYFGRARGVYDAAAPRVLRLSDYVDAQDEDARRSTGRKAA